MTGFALNGRPVEVVGEHPHLLSALREELGVTSVKDGCAPQGQCGCCTVLLDGKAQVSCLVGLEKVAGRSVVTLEGLTEAERGRFARAFAATGALQCGFCTPGMMLAAKALLDRNPDPTEDEVRWALSGNLCRCTGYQNIVKSVLWAAAKLRAQAPAD